MSLCKAYNLFLTAYCVLWVIWNQQVMWSGISLRFHEGTKWDWAYNKRGIKGEKIEWFAMRLRTSLSNTDNTLASADWTSWPSAATHLKDQFTSDHPEVKSDN